MRHLHRHSMQKLEKILSNGNHAYITGMRGTGKTALALDYAYEHFRDRCLYVNFETNYDIREYFSRFLESRQSGTAEDILADYYSRPDIKDSETLIILDEIHLISGNIPGYGSLIRDGSRGKVIFIDSESPEQEIKSSDCHFTLFPFTFDEFLDATGKEWYRDVIAGHFERMRPVPELVHNEINDIFSDYLMTGGMPQCVNTYYENGCEPGDPEIDDRILLTFRNITSAIEESGSQEAYKMLSILKNIPIQLAEGNTAFVFSSLRKGTSTAYYRNSIDMLCENNILINVPYKKHFCLYFGDFSFLSLLMRSSVSIAEDDFNNMIMRNYIAQSLTACGKHLEYWNSENEAYIDFIIKDNKSAIPVKLIGNSRKKLRSLTVYEKNGDGPGYAVGYENFNIMGNVKIIPQYAVFGIK